jgi:hypothetical protein
MSEASYEMLKQLELYADTITAFATVQLLSFTYLMAQGGSFTKNVLNHVCVPIWLGLFVNAGYITLVCLCHRGEDRILEATEAREDVIQEIAKSVRKTRYINLILDCVMTLGVLGLIVLGVYLHEFHFDCKS